MERWLVVMLAGALWAGAGAARFTDYAAAQMPQYEAVNYDSHVRNAPLEENYHDHELPVDVVPIDYNDYGRSNNDRTLKKHNKVDSLPAFKNPRKWTTTVVMDYGDSDYNYKSENKSPRMRVSRKSSNNRNKSKMNLGRNADDQLTALDDEDTEIPSKQYEEEEESNSEHDRTRFVRRDIRQKDNQQSWPQRNTGIRLSDPEYDDRGDDGEHIKGTLKRAPDYSEPEPPRHRPNSVLPMSRPHKPVANDVDESPSLVTGKYRAPMPGYRKKTSEYVDYNDMSRIEKIKNLSARRSTVMSGASQSQRWSYQENFRRRNMPLEQIVKITTTPSVNESVTPSNNTNLPIQIAELSPEVIQNITAFINKSRQLSLAEKSQLSILKKAQRKDTAKDEMLKDKPPVLLQVTEKLQTVVMVEPPVSQEPWLRARDISEDSPERIEKVKRFMRNKLVATARNVSELTENWDDTICDYVDISLLERKTNSTGNGTVADQLQAALDQKEPAPTITVLTTAITPEPLPSFKPDSVDSYQDAQWNQFLISTNHTTRQQFSMFVYLFTLILLLINI